MGDVQESVATREGMESSEQPTTSEEQKNPQASQSSVELAQSSGTGSTAVAASLSPRTDSLQNTNHETQATSEDVHSSSNASAEPKPDGNTQDQQHPDHSAQPIGIPSVEVEPTQEAESAVKVEPDSRPESDSKDLKAEPDPRSTLRHVLADPSPPRASSEREPPSEERATQPAEQEAIQTASPRPSSASQSKDRPATPQAPAEPTEGANQPNLAAITYTLRKNANGGFSTVYSGSRIKYLKKDDGLPFWRSDIQYTMLKHIFEDKTRVFTKYSNGTTGHTFCEIYVDAMANSSKCSQTLKEKLLFEYDNAEQAIDLAMVCLLVNVGRMNTTVNFFPEMRARVRTFHPIPCLQANTNPSAYKQLQDGPRLKSILKGAMEDMPQPSSLEQLVTHPKPRTNPVNLIFVLAQYAPRVSDLHFPSGMDFFDLFMRNNLSSKSRATAFLWMIWWYLESDFTAADSQRNPFGLGQAKRTPELAMSAILSMIGVDTRVPEFETLSEEDAAKENEDPQNELDYGEAKRLERQRILSTDAPKRSFGAAEDHHSYASPSHPADDPPRSSYADHHYRNSHHLYPKGSSYYNSSPSRASHARDRRSPSPHRPRAFGDHRSRGQDVGRDPTRSQSPSSAPDRRSGSGRDSFYIRGASPDEEPRRGPGRGNYTRRQKLHPIQPFEQMYRPDQFDNSTSAPPGYQYTPEWGAKSALHPNGYSPSSRHSEAQRVPAGDHYGQGSSRERLWRGASHPSGSHHSEPPSLAPAPSGSPDEDGHHPRSNERRHSMQRRQYYNDRAERMEKRVVKDLRTTGKKRTRPTAEQARTAEQERQDRVIQILEANANAIKTAKRLERKRRGPIVDAWIKCRALPEGYDSEDDELNRMGGIDDHRREGTEDITEATLGMTLGNEGKVVMWNAGDVGQQSESIARLWRRVARINGAGDVVERERARLRGEDGYGDDYFDRELENGDNDIEHALKGQRGGAIQAAADRSSMLIEDDDDSVVAEPAPKKRRKPMVKRGKLSGPSRTSDGAGHTRKGKRTSGAAGKQKRTSGVPTDQFFGNGASDGPASSKLKGRTKMRTTAAVRRASGPRAKRQAPSAKESEVEEDKTEVEQKEDEDMKQESANGDQDKGGAEAEEGAQVEEEDEIGEVDKELLAEADADGSDNDEQKNDAETAPDESFASAAEPTLGIDGDTEMTVDA